MTLRKKGAPAPAVPVAPITLPPDFAFTPLGLSEPLLRSVFAAGYTQPTPIQLQAIPPALMGQDILGSAQTGTGKTAAFVLPLLQRMQERPLQVSRGSVRALILAPTRELAAQIQAAIVKYSAQQRVKTAVIYGGVGMRPQIDAVNRGLDILVATPGRLWDLMGQGYIDLTRVEFLILDEVDRMVDQGFWPTVRQILAEIPKERQTSFFSATMPDSLRPFIKQLLNNPVKVSVSPDIATPDRIAQQVFFVKTQAEKKVELLELLGRETVERAVVFTRTKHGANRVAQELLNAGINADAIHGNKSQNARERSLAAFRAGRVHILVATDVAARGLDITGVSHVMNYDLPEDPESYVHRIGRTARAGKDGIAFSFCSNEERPLLARIERYLGKKFAGPRPQAHPGEAAPGPHKGRGPRNAPGRSQARARY